MGNLGFHESDLRLDSWKEIAAYLQRSVRTVQRWEREESLPVHRIRHKQASSVFAYRAEMDSWIESRQASQAKAAREEPSSNLKGLLVAPFSNLTSLGQWDRFGEGLAAELQQLWGLTGSCRLVAARDTDQLSGATDWNEEAKRRQARFLLEGSLRTSGERLRISFRLLDVRRGEVLAAESLDRPRADPLALQEEMARRILEALPFLTSKTRQAADPRLIRLCQKGRRAWESRSPQGLLQSVDCFQRALRIDPSHGAALVGLADVYNMLGYHCVLPPQEAFAKARKHAMQALQIDPKSAAAHASLAFIQMFADWDWESARQSFQRSLGMDPDSLTAHYWSGIQSALQGRPLEAVLHVRQAYQLDPSSPVIGTYVGGALYYGRQFDQAADRFQQILSADPEFAPARIYLAWTLRQQFQFIEAAGQFRRAIELTGSAEARAGLGHVLGLQGRRSESQGILDELREARSKSGQFISAGHLAWVQLGLGHHGLVFTSLEEAIQERFCLLAYLKIDPLYDPIRPDKRFDELLKKIGLG